MARQVPPLPDLSRQRTRVPRPSWIPFVVTSGFGFGMAPPGTTTRRSAGGEGG